MQAVLADSAVSQKFANENPRAVMRTSCFPMLRACSRRLEDTPSVRKAAGTSFPLSVIQGEDAAFEKLLASRHICHNLPVTLAHKAR